MASQLSFHDHSQRREYLTELSQKAFSERDHGAFNELVRLERSSLIGRIYQLVGNREDAEDLTQEVFLRAWLHGPEFRHDSHVTTWLYKLATNAGLDALRRRHTRAEEYLDDVRPDVLSSPDISYHLIAKDEYAKLATVALSAYVAVPAEKRTTLLREFGYLWTIDEEHEITGINPCSIKSRRWRAKMVYHAKLGSKLLQQQLSRPEYTLEGITATILPDVLHDFQDKRMVH